jgi:hypothetical protein
MSVKLDRVYSNLNATDILGSALFWTMKWGKSAVRGLRICSLTTCCIDSKRLCTVLEVACAWF